MFENRRKKLHKLGQLAFSLIFLQNTDLFEKYIQTLVRRTSSNFNTP